MPNTTMLYTTFHLSSGSTLTGTFCHFEFNFDPLGNITSECSRLLAILRRSGYNFVRESASCAEIPYCAGIRLRRLAAAGAHDTGARCFW